MRLLRWNDLGADARSAALARPRSEQGHERRAEVARLIAQVRADGDHTLRLLTRRFDGVELSELRVSPMEFEHATATLEPPVKRAIDTAIARIRGFHEASRVGDCVFDAGDGIRLRRLARPIDRVGLYVPAGSAPLPSTAIMLAVPARLAGCRHIVLCSPPGKDGRIDAAVLYVAHALGIEQVFKLGGVQAIAAMAYGSPSVPKCDKLFGPGNAWVTEAKLQVAADLDGAAIDMPAGPSEVLVIADAGANPAFVAADLLSQAEHGPDSQVILISDSEALINAVQRELAKQLAELPRSMVASAALANSLALSVADLDTAIEISNRYAPEHLILAVRDPESLVPAIVCAGSVFLGDYAPESVGDYCSGTNHVLPTAGMARAYSGVSVASFQKFITVQDLSAQGLRMIGDCAITLATAEGLQAHARAVQLRLEAMS